MCAQFEQRRKVIVSGLQKMGLETPLPRGAFYAFPRVTPYLDARGSSGLCEDLLEEQNLAVVPGSAFGTDDCIRLSYATSLETIERALDRLATFLKKRTPRAAPAAR